MVGEGRWFEVELLGSSTCDERLSSFRFAKPEGYVFAPGQYAMVRVTTADGLQAKPFTLSQAPSDPYLEITTRMSSSAFKRTLDELKPGSTLEVSSAKGAMLLPEDRARVVFLTGGVGITPARSILRDAASRGGEGLEATVLYGNLDDSCVPFAEELRTICEQGWCELVLVYQEPPKGWTGETGFITAETVRRHVDMAAARPYVVSGPPAMVDAMERVLEELQVPEADRVIERFSGY